MIALAEPLCNAKLQKSHLDLELEILEQAAELVVTEEEEKEDEEDSSSDDSSEEESEDEQVDDSAVTQHKESTDTGEPRGNGTVPKGDAITVDVQLQHRDGEPREPRRMIEELGERLGEGLRIKEDVPRETDRVSSRNTDGESGGERDNHQRAAGMEREARNTAKTGELLNQKNTLRVITTDGLDSDDDEVLTVENEGH